MFLLKCCSYSVYSMFLNSRMHMLYESKELEILRNGLCVKNLQDVNTFNVIYHQNEAVFIMVANDMMLQNMSFCSTQYSELNFPSFHPIVFSFSACLCVCVFFSMCNMCTYACMWAHSNMCTYAHRDLCIHYVASLCVRLCLQD